MRSAARPVVPAPHCLWCSAALATTALRSGQPCCIFCLTSSAADGTALEMLQPRTCTRFAPHRLGRLAFQQRSGCKPPARRRQLAGALKLPTRARVRGCCLRRRRLSAAEENATRAHNARQAAPAAQRTLRSTSQLRCRTRRGPLRPRLGSPHGCGAADGLRCRSGTRGPRAHRARRRCPHRTHRRNGRQQLPTCRPPALFPGLLPKLLLPGLLAGARLSARLNRQNHFVEQARNKKSPGIAGG